MDGNEASNVFFAVVATSLKVGLEPPEEGLFISNVLNEGLKFGNDWGGSNASSWESWNNDSSVASVGNISVEDGSESSLELWDGLSADTLEDKESFEGGLLGSLGIGDS